MIMMSPPTICLPACISGAAHALRCDRLAFHVGRWSSWVSTFTALALALTVTLAFVPTWPASIEKAAWALFEHLQWEGPFELRPFPSPLVRKSSLFDDAYRQSMRWGTLRSGFYCGAHLLNSAVASRAQA